MFTAFQSEKTGKAGRVVPREQFQSGAGEPPKLPATRPRAGDGAQAGDPKAEQPTVSAY